jgi:hypothetical protein
MKLTKLSKKLDKIKAKREALLRKEATLRMAEREYAEHAYRKIIEDEVGYEIWTFLEEKSKHSYDWAEIDEARPAEFGVEDYHAVKTVYVAWEVYQ